MNYAGYLTAKKMGRWIRGLEKNGARRGLNMFQSTVLYSCRRF